MSGGTAPGAMDIVIVIRIQVAQSLDKVFLGLGMPRYPGVFKEVFQQASRCRD